MSNKMINNRTVYRKTLKVQGQLIYANYEFNFSTINLSLNGLKAYTEDAVLPLYLDVCQEFFIKLPSLNLEGIVLVLWVNKNSSKITSFGLKFIEMRGTQENRYYYMGTVN